MPPRRKPVSSSSPAAPAGPDARVPALQLEAFERYLRTECGHSENSIAAYLRDQRKFVAWWQEFCGRPLPEITLSDLAGYQHWLFEAQLAATSIGRHLASLKIFFRFLVTEGLLAESQADLLSAPKLWQNLPKVLSPQKVNELLAAPGPTDNYSLRDRAILTTLYATGCRASEIVSLELRHLDLTTSTCRVTGKGDKERLVSLNPVAVLSLEKYLQFERPDLAGSRDVPYVFLGRGGQAFSRIAIWGVVKKYAARVGISDEVSPHTLRHSFATHMLAGGAEIRALQELLGHANIRTTQVYTHVEHSRLKNIHEKHHPRG